MHNHAGDSGSSTVAKWLQGVLVALFLGVAAFYSIVIPPGEGVDEIPHFDFVRYVKDNWALPVQPMSLDGEIKVWMGHHPPLYYLLGALATSWTDTSDWDGAFRANPHFVWQENDGANGWNVFMHVGQESFPWQGSILALHVMRLVTVALGAIAVFAIFAACRLLLAGDAWLAAGATALVVFNPSFVFMSSTVHHDTLQAAIFALGAWWLMALLRGPEHDHWFYIAGGLLAGAAALTKLSGAVLLAIMGLGLALKAARDRDAARLLRRASLVLGVAFVVAGWWYVRNQLLYGDPLGWRMFLATQSHMVRTTPYTWSAFTDEFLPQIGRTFWGAFGYMHITFPEITRYFWILSAVGLGGLAVALARKQIDLKQQWAAWVVAISLLVAIFLAFVRFSAATAGAGHGRYLFPAAFTIGALVVAGLRGFTGKRLQPVTTLFIAAGMLLYAILLPVTQVLPLYAPPEAVSPLPLPDHATEANLTVAQGVELAAYRLESQRIVPGHTLPVTLYWRATGDSTARQDPQVQLELMDDAGRALDSQVLWPAPSLPPSVWPAGQLLVSHTVLYPPADLPSNKMALTLTPVLAGQANTSARRTLAELITTGGVTQVDGSQVPNPRQEVFASEIKLRGYSVGAADTFAPGAVVPLDLYWEVLQKPSENYTVFIHLLNQSGEQASGFDRPAGGEALPTLSWQPGWTLRESFPLTIPETLPAGEYTIRVGMYTWPSLVRLPITLDDNPVGDSIDLSRIQIMP